jgi:hypothetical protein
MRARRGAAVVLKICTHCIDEKAAAANDRITDALAMAESVPESREEDDDREQASPQSPRDHLDRRAVVRADRLIGYASWLPDRARCTSRLKTTQSPKPRPVHALTDYNDPPPSS